MAKTIIVTVTANDIKTARKLLKDGAAAYRCQVCPVAQALRRRYKDTEVGFDSFSIGNRSVKLPEKVSKFIERFDLKLSVKPFRFTVKV